VLPHRAAIYFRRIRRSTGIKKADHAARLPGLRDLRHTFAVHRISAWYREKAHLDLMLPRLAAYMGLCNLSVTERYLPLTPRHFRQQVGKLLQNLATTLKNQRPPNRW